MADNVAITAGSGTTVATDDVGGVHYQKVKVAIGASDTANLLAVGAGAVDTGTPRVTLASDDPAVASLAALSKEEDAVHSSGDKGIMPLAVRRDAGTNMAADGDYHPLTVNSAGALWTNSTIAGLVPGNAATQLGKAVDAAAGATDTGVATLAVRDDALSTLTPAEGDYAPLRVNSTGALHTADDALLAAIAGVAHDAAASSVNPVLVGGYLDKTAGGPDAASTAIDAVRSRVDASGALVTRPNTNLESIVTGNASNTDGASTSCIAASGDAAIKHYLTTIILTNMSSTGIYVEIKDGATAKLTIPLPGNSGAVVNLPVPLPGTANTAWNFDPSTAATTVYCSMIGFKSKV